MIKLKKKNKTNKTQVSLYSSEFVCVNLGSPARYSSDYIYANLAWPGRAPPTCIHPANYVRASGQYIPKGWGVTL